MSEVAMTPFERRVLARIAKRLPVSGSGMAHFTAGARRLEAKGLAGKGVKWYLTEKGKHAMAQEPAPLEPQAQSPRAVRTEVIHIAKDFSRYPGGRWRTDGEFSGQRFREELLAPALNAHDRVILELDGTLGYGSSFLEEAFGGLIREDGFTPRGLRGKLVLQATDFAVIGTITAYITEASARRERDQLLAPPSAQPAMFEIPADKPVGLGHGAS